MKKIFFLIVLLLSFSVVHAQVNDVTLSSDGVITYNIDNANNLVKLKYKLERFDGNNNGNTSGETTISEGSAYRTQFILNNNGDFCLSPVLSTCNDGSFVLEAEFIDANGNSLGSFTKGFKVANGVYTSLTEYTLEFNVITDEEGHGFGNSKIVYEGQKIQLTVEEYKPTMGDLVFTGWYNDPEFTDSVPFYTTIEITGNRTLYGKMVDGNQTFTVTFDTDGGGEIPSQEVKVLESAEVPNNPKKDGYIFSGWCRVTKDNCEPVSIEYYAITENTTFKAKYMNSNKAIDKINLYVKLPHIGDEYALEQVATEWGSTMAQVPELYMTSLDDRYKASFINLFDDTHDTLTGKVEKDKEYIVGLYVRLNEELENEITFVDTAEIIVNNEVVKPIEFFCYYASEEGSRETAPYNFCNIEFKVKSTDQLYGIIDGANQSINRGSELTVRTDGEVKNLKEIKVDGKVVDKENYTIKEGSTIVTLKEEYIKTLSDGEHTLTIVYNDGEVETKFTVLKDENPNTIDVVQTVAIISLASIIMMIVLFIANKKYHFIRFNN